MPKLGTKMPEMGNIAATKNTRPAHRKAGVVREGAPTSLADALFTTTQQRVLALLFGQPNRSFYASEMIERTGSGSGAVQRELKRLASSGLVTVKRIGNQRHYQANPDSPVFEELCGLVKKTVALAEPIRESLSPLADRMSLALLYGSIAKGTDTATSDIDILIVAERITLEHNESRSIEDSRFNWTGASPMSAGNSTSDTDRRASSSVLVMAVSPS